MQLPSAAPWTTQPSTHNPKFALHGVLLWFAACQLHPYLSGILYLSLGAGAGEAALNNMGNETYGSDINNNVLKATHKKTQRK